MFGYGAYEQLVCLPYSSSGNSKYLLFVNLIVQQSQYFLLLHTINPAVCSEPLWFDKKSWYIRSITSIMYFEVVTLARPKQLVGVAKRYPRPTEHQSIGFYSTVRTV